MSNVIILRIQSGHACLQSNSLRNVSNRSYVNSLEEKIRMLEARMNSGESASGQTATAGQETNMEYSQESNTINDFPLSPTSVKDVFELEDSQSLEVLEFGISNYTSSYFRRRLAILSSKRSRIHANNR